MLAIRTAMFSAAAGLVMVGSAGAADRRTSPVPSDAGIRLVLEERVDTYRQTVGIVTGAIEPGGRRMRTSPLLTAFPVQVAVTPRVETKLEPSIFDRYVGRYQLAPSAILTVSRDGGRFLAQLTGQPAFEIFAEGEKDFFLKVVDAQLTFETDAQNRAIAVVLHQNGIDQRAARIEGEPVVPNEVSLPAEVLERYVGEYQLAPGLVMTVRRDGTRLFVQLTGQPSIEVFASAEREFFYKVVNAQLTFEVGATGPATALVLHQNGQHPRAPRIVK